MDYKYLFDSTDRLCGAHVFVISGYLFFLRQDDGFTWAQYKAKMLRKCKILLLPFFIWNILGALSYPSRFIDATLTEKLLGFWSQRMEWGSWAGPWDGPLWFCVTCSL